MQVVLASRNAGKLKELQTLLEPLAFSLESQAEHNVPSADETGATFIENAIIKARSVCAATGLAALADDSGLVVPALHGAPGIYSARYAGIDGASSADRDRANNRKLIAELDGVTDRAAYFYCAVVFMLHAADPTPRVVTARWHGQIIDEPRGNEGFGYDPHFYLPSRGLTSAELPAAEKNRLSHRGQAIARFVAELSAG